MAERDDRVVVRCPECGKQLRIPANRTGVVTCTHHGGRVKISSKRRWLPSLAIISVLGLVWWAISTLLAGKNGSALAGAIAAAAAAAALLAIRRHWKAKLIADEPLRTGTTLFGAMSVVGGVFALVTWLASEPSFYLNFTLGSLIWLQDTLVWLRGQPLFYVGVSAIFLALALISLALVLQRKPGESRKVRKVASRAGFAMSLLSNLMAAMASVSLVAAPAGSQLVRVTSAQAAEARLQLEDAIRGLEGQVGVVLGQNYAGVVADATGESTPEPTPAASASPEPSPEPNPAATPVALPGSDITASDGCQPQDGKFAGCSLRTLNTEARAAQQRVSAREASIADAGFAVPADPQPGPEPGSGPEPKAAGPEPNPKPDRPAPDSPPKPKPAPKPAPSPELRPAPEPRSEPAYQDLRVGDVIDAADRACSGPCRPRPPKSVLGTVDFTESMSSVVSSLLPIFGIEAHAPTLPDDASPLLKTIVGMLTKDPANRKLRKLVTDALVRAVRSCAAALGCAIDARVPAADPDLSPPKEAITTEARTKSAAIRASEARFKALQANYDTAHQAEVKKAEIERRRQIVEQERLERERIAAEASAPKSELPKAERWGVENREEIIRMLQSMRQGRTKSFGLGKQDLDQAIQSMSRQRSGEAASFKMPPLLVTRCGCHTGGF